MNPAALVRSLLALLLLGSALAAPSAASLNLARRQELYRALMAAELEISRKVNDPILLKALQQEGDVKAREQQQASLSCRVMDRIEALEARQQPLRDKFQAGLRKKFGVNQSVIDAVLLEGQQRGWRY